jgi:hypothetical protein
MIQAIGVMHWMIANALPHMSVKTFDCHGAINFDQILKPLFSKELNKGGYGSHPHPKEGKDWTQPTGEWRFLFCLPLDPPPATMSMLRRMWCCRSQPKDHSLCAGVLGV